MRPQPRNPPSLTRPSQPRCPPPEAGRIRNARSLGELRRRCELGWVCLFWAPMEKTVAAAAAAGRIYPACGLGSRRRGERERVWRGEPCGASACINTHDRHTRHKRRTRGEGGRGGGELRVAFRGCSSAAETMTEGFNAAELARKSKFRQTKTIQVSWSHASTGEVTMCWQLGRVKMVLPRGCVRYTRALPRHELDLCMHQKTIYFRCNLWCGSDHEVVFSLIGPQGRSNSMVLEVRAGILNVLRQVNYYNLRRARDLNPGTTNVRSVLCVCSSLLASRERNQ